MKNNRLFKITLTNWVEHNPSGKKTYKKTMIPNNFCSDGKLRVVPVSHRWLFLGIILICGDHARDTVEISESMLRDMLESSKSIVSVLDQLQSLQLLTYTIVEFPLILNELKERKEKKRKELKGSSEKSDPQKHDDKVQAEMFAFPPSASKPTTRNVIAAYCDAWKIAYKVEHSPPIMQKHVGLLNSLTKSLGAERATLVVQAYLRMPDQWFLTKRHDIETLMANLNAVTQFIETGRMVSRKEAQSVENSSVMAQTARDIERGGI